MLTSVVFCKYCKIVVEDGIHFLLVFSTCKDTLNRFGILQFDNCDTSSSHWKLARSRHDIAENCWIGVKQQSLTHNVDKTKHIKILISPQSFKDSKALCFFFCVIKILDRTKFRLLFQPTIFYNICLSVNSSEQNDVLITTTKNEEKK